DRPCAIGDERFEFSLVDIQSAGPYIAEHRARAAKHKCVHRGDERERRDNHFVAGLEVEEQRRELERVGARSGEKRLWDSYFFFEPRVAPLSEVAVARNMAIFKSLEDVAKLVAEQTCPIERDVVTHCRHLVTPSSSLTSVYTI